VLIVWRIFDKQGTHVTGPGATTSGIEWGIFVALGVAASLSYAGSRIRAAHQPEPPLPGENGSIARDRARAARARRPRPPRPVAADRPPADVSPRDPTTRVTRDPRFGPSIVPDDPPTLRIGRATPAAGAAPATRRATPPPKPAQASTEDDQLTIPLDPDGFENL
jgi:hypothetical protein